MYIWGAGRTGDADKPPSALIPFYLPHTHTKHTHTHPTPDPQHTLDVCFMAVDLSCALRFMTACASCEAPPPAPLPAPRCLSSATSPCIWWTSSRNFSMVCCWSTIVSWDASSFRSSCSTARGRVCVCVCACVCVRVCVCACVCVCTYSI